MAELSERKTRKRRVFSKLPPLMLQELQSAAMNYLRPHVTDAVAAIEMLASRSFVLISNAVDPDRPIEETRTGQTLTALAAQGMSVFDWPLLGFQVHQEVRHAYVAPLPLKKALEALLIDLHVADRLRKLPLQYWVIGAFPRKTVQPWGLQTVAFTSHLSEVFRNIEGVYTTLSTSLHGVMPLENFTNAIKSAQVTPLQRKASSATFINMWKTASLATKLIAASSIRLKKLHQDPVFKANHSERTSSNMQARWMIAKYREAKRKAQLGNKVMQTLWQKQWFVDMKRAWYDDPVSRAMFRENGRRTLSKLRQRPEYVSKIAAINSARLSSLWEKSRDVMLGVAHFGKQAFLEKLRDPEWYAAFVARKHEPVHFKAKVQAAAAALEQRRGVCKSRYDAGLVEALVRMMTEHYSEEGLFEFSWRLMTAHSYAEALLVKLSACKPEDVELQIMIQRIRNNVGFGVAVWEANVDVVVLKRMYESASGFTPAKLAILNVSPTREMDVRHALGINRKKTSLGENVKQKYGIAEHGLKILTEEFPHVPASRKAHACAAGPGIDNIRDLVARFEGKLDEVGDGFAYESHEVEGNPDGLFCKACQKDIPKSYRPQHSKGVNHVKAVQSMRVAIRRSMPALELAAEVS